MGLADTDRAEEHQILLLSNELACFQVFPSEGRREGHAAVFIAGKGLECREASPFDEALFAMFIPQVEFSLQEIQQEIHLLRRRLVPAIFSPDGGQEEFPGRRVNLCDLLFLLGRRQHILSLLSRRFHRRLLKSDLVLGESGYHIRQYGQPGLPYPPDSGFLAAMPFLSLPKRLASHRIELDGQGCASCFVVEDGPAGPIPFAAPLAIPFAVRCSLPGPAILYQHGQGRTVIIGIRPGISILAGMAGNQLACFIVQDIYGIGTEPYQNLLLCQFWPGRVPMFSIDADFPITVRFTYDIAADIKGMGRQGIAGIQVFLEQVRNELLFLVMDFSGFLLVRLQQLSVEFIPIIEFGDRDE